MLKSWLLHSTIFVNCFLLIAAQQNLNCSSDVSKLSKIQRIQRTMTALMAQLKTDEYLATVAPNFPDETVISTQVWPFAISRVNEFDQTIRISSGIHMQWHDNRLAYDHRSTCSFPYRETLSTLSTTSSEAQPIWIPLLFMHGRQEVAADQFLKIVQLDLLPSGHVHLKALFTEIRSCNIKTRRFPFDEQYCPLKLEAFQNAILAHDDNASASRTIDILRDFRINRAALDVDHSTNEWQIYASEKNINLTLHQESLDRLTNQSTTVVYPLYLTRKYQQHVVNWIVSPVVLSVSSVIGMYRGCEVGERFGYGGTIVVTFTLMLGELRSVLGVSGDGYPILGCMYIGLELTLILATLLSSAPERCYKQMKTARAGGNQITVKGSVKREISAQKNCYVVKFCRLTQDWNSNAFDTAFMLVLLAMQFAVVGVAVVLWIRT